MVDLTKKTAYDPGQVAEEDMKPKKGKYFPALESGYYEATIEEIEVASTKQMDQKLKITFVVKHGNDKQYLKRSIWISHDNETCIRIGFAFLKQMFSAIGKPDATETDLLLGEKVLIDVEKSDAYNEDELFKAKSGVRYYYECRVDKAGYFNRVAAVLSLDDEEASTSMTERKKVVAEAKKEEEIKQTAVRRKLIQKSSKRPQNVEVLEDDIPY